jgi:two-component system osmolarity sensor histidine kinase EnvZ
MHTRIRRQMDQRTAMLAGVSHDLRTPLTRMKLQLAMMGDSSDVTDMKGDIMAMERMIEGYLDFVRGEGDEQAVFTGLNELIDKIVEAVRRNGITVNVDVQGDLGMALKPIAMERCLVNLISNAGKYADNVWVRAWKDQDFLRILIEDDGPGIPEDQYDDVFKPFYRVDTSRNAATGGVGLGMPIAMDIVHNHGGEIVLEKSVRGGLAVHIALPM